jgi:HK97 family phage portal protein
MRLFGVTLPALRRKALPPGTQTVEQSRGWFRLGAVLEPFTGAWQRNIVGNRDDILTHTVVYACLRLISADIGKVRIRLVEQNRNNIWEETTNTAHSPVLRKPNRYQTRIKFIEQWVLSKLTDGNAYILKDRDSSGIVRALYVLDPQRVKALVAPDGSVYYRIQADNLAGVGDVTVPASEVIHDVHTTLHHPLCGISPITACALTTTAGLNMQRQSSIFFGSGALPSGILEWPDEIDESQQQEIQSNWQRQFSGPNVGRIAVLTAGAKFQQMTMSAVDAQLIDQLRYTAENICTAFGVPPYMVGVGNMPTYTNIEALNQQYYQQTLQEPMECIEALLDEGLDLGRREGGGVLGTEFDLDDLIKMDSASRIRTAKEAVTAGMSVNEARFRYMDLSPVDGGEKPFLQHQNWPIQILANRQPEDLDPKPVAPAPAPKPEPADATTKALPPAEFEAVLLAAFEEEFAA